MEIKYVDKKKLSPAFGMAYKDRIEIREDLPDVVKPFIEAHETYHVKDTSKFWLWREIKANCYAGRKNPIGFAGVILLSLSPDRLKYYWNRIKKGK